MLEAEDVACLRAERLVFAGVRLALAPGEALLLRGPNGAGKSTLIRVLAGLLRPEAGCVRWQGLDVRADVVAHGARVGLVGHQDAVKPALSVAQNLALFVRPDAAARALEAMGLASLAGLPARLLSAGQKRRLALARLIAQGRPLWLLDEPSLGLDDAAIARLGVAVEAHLAAGGMMVAATHVALPVAAATTLTLDGLGVENG